MSFILKEDIRGQSTVRGATPRWVGDTDPGVSHAGPRLSITGLRLLVLTAPTLALVLVIDAAARPPSVLLLLVWAALQLPLVAYMQRRQLVRQASVLPTVGEMVELGSRAEAAEAALRKDEEMLHELRATVVGITMAHRLLKTAGDDIHDATRERLTQLEESEMARLERMIVGVPERTSNDIDLGSVVRPLVESLRLRGHVVDCHGHDVRAVGRPDDIAEITHVLLQNAARHARGSDVRVTVFRTSTTAGIHVSDDGPGVPSELVPRVFDRGCRGSGSHGQGLGLHIARDLARDMGGDLVLEPSSRGASFVLTLPVSQEAVVPCLAHSA
jgi:signal transduction histidine kinase